MKPMAKQAITTTISTSENPRQTAPRFGWPDTTGISAALPICVLKAAIYLNFGRFTGSLNCIKLPFHAVDRTHMDHRPFMAWRIRANARRSRRRRRAMTLIESMVATAILAGVTLVASLTLTSGAQNTARADNSSRAARIARDLIEEIRSKAYQEPVQTPLFGPEPGETNRFLYNDMDDYNGWKENAGSLQTATGEYYPAADQHFSRSVTVADVSQTISDLGMSMPGRTVTIIVKHQSGEQWQFVQFFPKPN